ncbi:PA0069 family radical SAM protein [Uliginosibacterium sp. H1]|uniref:PA0069 family radical SAM protein n=1 Tax=Uliginosibacterium sp. H1 TaxID=3114757 RepID=UPI002E182BAF|nr:PA0069 family radical SAM protein [Uliginosibacterium sp. H1]
MDIPDNHADSDESITRPLRQVFRGRGAVARPDGRFESMQRDAHDDGWGSLDEHADAPPPKTELLIDRARKIISTNDSPDISFDYSVNPYKGCEHGCSYCFARPTHSYLGLSPGLDFETKISYKPDAAGLLRKELANPRYVCKPIALGINTDAWQPIERKLGITRALLEVMVETRHPISVVTKGALIERDIDLLADLARDELVHVYFSVTTLDRKLARRLEPRAASPQRRLELMAALHAAGVPVGVLFAPLIPALNDHEMEAVLEAASAAGAKSAGYVLLRLPHEVAPLFEAWLQEHYPGRAAHVMSLVHQLRGGKAYDSAFGKRMRGEGQFADLYSQRMRLACNRLKLNKRGRPLNTSAFVPPRPPRPASAQGELF